MEVDCSERFWGFIWLLCLLFSGVKSQVPDKAHASGGSSFNQLLEIKGASHETVSHQVLLIMELIIPSLCVSW